MEKRILVIGLIFLLVFSSVVPISICSDVKITNKIIPTTNQGNTLYVGRSSVLSSINSYKISSDQVDQQQILYDYILLTSIMIAQSFKPALNKLTKVEIMVFSVETVTGNVSVSIRDNLYGDDLTLIQVNANKIPTNYTWVEFNFPDITVTVDRTYYIIFDPMSKEINMGWLFKKHGSPYSKGEMWFYDGFNNYWEKYDANQDSDFTFKTYGYHINNPPNTSTITGPNCGVTGIPYKFIFNSVDKDNDQVKYFIDWGDGKTDITALKPSGINREMYHRWDSEGAYIIKVKVQDEHGLNSTEAIKTVNMPRNRTINIPFTNCLQNHPNIFLFFQKLLNRL